MTSRQAHPEKGGLARASEKGISYYETAGIVERVGLKDVECLSQRSLLTHNSKKLILVMVGMPARGKSFIAAKLYSFLSWSGYKTRVFNVGAHRRSRGGEENKRSAHSEASFFDSSNLEAKARREALAMEVLDSLLAWLLEEEGDIGIFDATNSTRARRRAVVERCGEHPSTSVVFVESLCDDLAILDANMRTKVTSSPDFRGMDFESALVDLRKRIANYEKSYEPVQDVEGAYVKMHDFSSKITANLCFGRMSKTVVPFCAAIHSDDRPVFVTALAPRQHEPEFVAAADVDVDFGPRLAEWWWRRRPDSRLSVYSSTMPLAIDAAKTIQSTAPDLVTLTHTSALNPLLVCADPNVTSAPKRRDLHDRGPDSGESYADLVSRLETVLLDIEASVDSVLIVTHATPARALRAYFKNIRVIDCMGPSTSPETKALADAVPAVLELGPKVGGGWLETIHVL
ncbi:hypothetical protein CTAYLR_007872 [Chrysophaeum taylorii]|uniref:6-phosphofructo-2-kinase domain-containing protein n=1 Tax=Chrysophaeum taylorii TaxID=2483200 RepID=A0AAD7XI28_9STRA|nr:hypothetical protein CTAYLR_006804 [Chrysophaeum taylorii]KAJ8602307.1 hypothetical protein CTAYLR_007872 [Chrysophaeum taylorii]